MKSFWKAVNGVISEADIILHIVDARNVNETRNKEIENKVKKKVLIYVINKCDLVDKDILEREKKELKNSVFVSSTEYHGMRKLKEKIIIAGKRLGIEKPRVGVLGYPNVGKSSVINALKGKGSARTSSQSGFTKGKQDIAAKKFTLIDTPGVIPYKEEESALNGSIDFSKVKEPEVAVYDLMEKFPDLLKFYKVEDLDELAIKKNFLKKKAEPDSNRAARFILKEWQEGKINFKS